MGERYSEGEYITARHDDETKAIIKDITSRKINKSEFIREAIKHYYHRQLLMAEIENLKTISAELAESLKTIKNGLVLNPPQSEIEPQKPTACDDDILLAGLADIIGRPDYDDNEVVI